MHIWGAYFIDISLWPNKIYRRYVFEAYDNQSVR